jgi:diadenosine tetraphosphate (Ap4A) HIT family hydrolase
MPGCAAPASPGNRVPVAEGVACVFCNLPASEVVAANGLAFAVRGKAPVTPGHSLVLPRRHVASRFGLTPEERRAIDDLLAELRADILARDPAVRGFNIGINVDEPAGQTIDHCHVHLVERRPGDGEGVMLCDARKRLI